MASIPRTQQIYIEPQSVISKQGRHRHRFLKAVILLTVPFYCVGFTLLSVLRIEALLNRVAASPLLLGGLAFFVLLLLMEPFTGAVTNSCAVGIKCASVGVADPMSCLTLLGGCLTVIGVLAGLVALGVWLL